MSTLPKSIALGLQRFQKVTKTVEKVYPHKTSATIPAGGSETIIYRFGSSGIVDLKSIALMLNATFTKTSGAAVGTAFFPLASMIRRLEILVGGSTIFGGSVADFGSAYVLRRSLAEPAYVNSNSNKVYDLPEFPEAGGVAINYMMADMPLSNSNVRFLPLSAIPELEIRVTYDLSKIPSDNTYSAVLNESYILYSKLVFDDNLIDELVSRRMAELGVFEMSLEQWNYQSGSQFTNNGDYQFSIATQDLEYVILTNKSSTATGASQYNFSCGGNPTTVTHQLYMSGTPISSFPLKVQDVFWNTVEALDGHGGNMGVDIQVANKTDWETKRFMYCHRFGIHPADSIEAQGLISGISTYGNTVPMIYSVKGGSGTFTPQAFMVTRSIVELRPGKVVGIVP